MADQNELIAKLQSFAEQAKERAPSCKNEQETKNYLIEPYLQQILGYDASNPAHVRLEFSTDHGKPGESVDCAILKDDKPFLLVEAKPTTERPLPEKPTTQLNRYAGDTENVLCAAYTNGLTWHWYRKRLDNKKRLAKLDDTPFLKVDVCAPKQAEVSWLTAATKGRTRKSTEDAMESEVMRSAIAEWLIRMKRQPSDKLLKLMLTDTGYRSVKQNLKQARQVWVRVSNQSRAASEHEQHEPPAGAEKEKNGKEPVKRTIRCGYHVAGRSEWKTVRNATELLASVVEYCAQHHGKGRNHYLGALEATMAPGRIGIPLLVRAGSEQLGHPNNWSRDFGGYCVFNNISNPGKIRLIRAYLKRCLRLDGTSPELGKDIFVKMPNANLEE